MPTDRMADNQWDTLVTELRGFQDEGQEAWGGIDDMSIARYLAGDCDQRERDLVEQAARSSPDVRDCIDLARQALGGDSPEPVVPLSAASQQPSSPTAIRRGWPAVLRNLAVAASILAILAGGAYELVRIKADSADALAKVTAVAKGLQEQQEEIVKQTGAKTPAEVPDEIRKMQRQIQDKQEQLLALRAEQAHVAAIAGVESFDKIPEEMKELRKAVSEREKQVADLRRAQMQVAGSVGVDSLEAIPRRFAKLQQSIETLQAGVDDVRRKLASCGNSQNPTPNGNSCGACGVSCARSCCCMPQPACSCCPVPAPCGCAGSSQASVSVASPLAGLAISRPDSEGWISVREGEDLQPSPTPTFALAAPKTTAMPAASPDNRRWYAFRPVSCGGGGASAPAPKQSRALPSANGRETELMPIEEPIPVQSYPAVQSVRQASHTETPATSPPQATPRVVTFDDSGWRAARD